MFSTNPITGEKIEQKQDEASIKDVLKSIKQAVSREAKIKRLRKKLAELKKQNALLKEEKELKQQIKQEQEKVISDALVAAES